MIHEMRKKPESQVKAYAESDEWTTDRDVHRFLSGKDIIVKLP